MKVWTIDPAPAHRNPRPSREPRTRQQIAERWSRPAENAQKRFEWKAEHGVWARFAVVAGLATAILWWPYARTCGFGLALYLGATTMIIVGGLWVVACTWILRMARTHAVAMIMALWGAALVTAQVLPRIGYAADTATWLCR